MVKKLNHDSRAYEAGRRDGAKAANLRMMRLLRMYGLDKGDGKAGKRPAKRQDGTSKSGSANDARRRMIERQKRR